MDQYFITIVLDDADFDEARVFGDRRAIADYLSLELREYVIQLLREVYGENDRQIDLVRSNG